MLSQHFNPRKFLREIELLAFSGGHEFRVRVMSYPIMQNSIWVPHIIFILYSHELSVAFAVRCDERSEIDRVDRAIASGNLRSLHDRPMTILER